MYKKIFLLLLIVLLGGIGFFLYRATHSTPADRLVLYGNVDVRIVNIGFRVPGQVSHLYVEEGDYVKEGDFIARLCPTPYDTEQERAEAELLTARANLENAKLLADRRETLIKVGGVSQETVDDARTSLEVSLAQVAASEAALLIAKERLSYTVACAPTDGVVLTRIREPGSVVQASDPVCTLSVSSPVWIRAYVSEPDLGHVYYGMRAEVTTDTKGAPVYVGRVGFISPIAEFTPKSVETTELRTDLVYRLRVYVDQPDHLLKQGMPVTVTLHHKSSQQQDTGE